MNHTFWEWIKHTGMTQGSRGRKMSTAQILLQVGLITCVLFSWKYSQLRTFSWKTSHHLPQHRCILGVFPRFVLARIEFHDTAHQSSECLDTLPATLHHCPPLVWPGGTVGGECGKMDVILTGRQLKPQPTKGGGCGWGWCALTRASSRSSRSSELLKELTSLINSHRFCLRQA